MHWNLIDEDEADSRRPVEIIPNRNNGADRRTNALIALELHWQ
jgi:hypothetical protein